MIDLRGKVTIITGCSSGIGFETAKLFVELGSFVYGVDVNPSPQDLLLYNNFKFEQLDLRELGAPEKVVNGALNVFGGRVDILLNIAGVMDTNNSVDNLEEDTWDRIVAINLTVPTMLSKHVVKAFRNQGGGNIVNVSSKAGISGAVAGVAYTATKHALIGITKNVAWRYHREGIRCNAICPGGFVTNIGSSIDWSRVDQEAMRVIAPVQELHVPGLQPTATSDNCARLMAFLASEAAGQINGAIIPIDNAWSCI